MPEPSLKFVAHPVLLNEPPDPADFSAGDPPSFCFLSEPIRVDFEKMSGF